MKRTARLDGTNDSGIYSPVAFVRDPRGLTKEELLKMREQGMTNASIARAVNSKSKYVQKLIGKTPESLVEKSRMEGLEKARAVKAIKEKEKKEDSAVSENKEVDPVDKSAKDRVFPISGLERFSRLRAVIRDLHLEGCLFDYHVMPEYQCIDITYHCKNKVLGNIKFDDIATFVEELMDVLGSIKELQ